MKNISSQYQELQEGKMTKHQFLRNARMMFPSFITNQNSFADSVAILKTKGMLVEGDAVKGTPDKEPTYDSPTPDAKTKYKKVEQSPEVDEQDGVYPATTLTDIPKVKANKKVKDTSSGLEPIKDKDTKNEMKKVKVVKEGVQNAARGTAQKDITTYAAQQRKIDNASRKGHSGDLPSDNNTVGASQVFNKDSNRLNRALKKDYPDLNKENVSPEDLKGAEKEITKNDASIQTMADRLGISQEELFKMLLKRLGGLKESINYDNLSKHSIKDLESLIDVKKKEREKLRSNTNIPPAVQNTVKELGAQISKIEREINSKKAQSLDENERSFDDVFGDFIETDDATEIKAFIKAKGRDAIAKIKAKLPVLKDQARQKVAKLMKIELDETRTKQTQTLSIKERLKPAITKLVQEVLDEMGQE
jgi:hypothetical protein